MRDAIFRAAAYLVLALAAPAAFAGTCELEGRVFAEKTAVPSKDCNQCTCLCHGGLLGIGATCGVACTEMACERNPRSDAGTKVFTPDGIEAPYTGVNCPAGETKECAEDGDYMRACATAGGKLVDNGCCQFACTVKVTRRAAKAFDASACREARAALDEIWLDLDSTLVDMGGQKTRMHPRHFACKDANDCVVAPRHAIWSCPLPIAAGATVYAALKPRVDALVAEVERACPRFEAASCAEAGARVACVQGKCALAP